MVVVDLMKAQLPRELQHFGSGDWVIALQAASSTFSEQDQQSLFDMLKGRPKNSVVTLINNHYHNKYFIITIIQLSGYSLGQLLTLLFKLIILL